MLLFCDCCKAEQLRFIGCFPKRSFLDATKHLYKRVCTSVLMSARPSVTHFQRAAPRRSQRVPGTRSCFSLMHPSVRWCSVIFFIFVCSFVFLFYRSFSLLLLRSWLKNAALVLLCSLLSALLPFSLYRF